MWQEMLSKIIQGDYRTIARVISLIENETEGYEQLLEMLPHQSTPVIGITGPPGAGKSTLVDSLVGALVARKKSVAVVCVDPSSPFNRGAILGDRIRMSRWYNHDGVFIRSLATRGSLGGLHPHIIEITELLKVAPFDYIVVETVGVGQSEVEIVGLADCTTVVLVPEAGDEVQTMKAGLMEIADIFLVNKADRPDAEKFVRNLRQMLAPGFYSRTQELPILTTIASTNTGITTWLHAIEKQLEHPAQKDKRAWLLTERAYHLIENKRMKDINKWQLKEEIEQLQKRQSFNLYQFVKRF